MLQTASSLLYHFSHYSLWPDFQICSKTLKQFCLLKYVFKVQRADLTCDVIRKVALFVLSKL